jgi:uncharacterized membrane protein (DUF485 family)
MLTSVTAIPVRALSYIHDTDLELELELVLLVDEIPSTPVNNKLVAKINTITGKMSIIIFLDFIYFLQVLAGSYYPFLVILPLYKALGILNSHITNSIYKNRANTAPRNRRIKKMVQYGKR